MSNRIRNSEISLGEWRAIKPLVVEAIALLAVENSPQEMVGLVRQMMADATAATKDRSLKKLCELLGFMTAMEDGMDRILEQTRKDN